MGRRAILLQGPVGPFFARLQETLDAQGWETVRVLFNAGDRAFHGRGADVSFSEPLDHWPRWLESFLTDYEADVVLLFGDQRPIHRAAVEVARAAGVETLCFEEGYLRPEYVTVERGGNNAASLLRKWRFDPSAPTPAVARPEPMPANGFRATAKLATHYFLTMRMGAMSFPYYRYHRERGAIGEASMWSRNAWRKWRRRTENLQKIQSVVEALDDAYFVVALQVHDDMQLTRHGCGWTIEKLIASAVSSFARCGHPDHHLVFKGHPLDRGHSAGRDFSRKIAALHHVADRVHYVDDGSLGLLSRHSRGMVTVNSTSAMVSLAHGKPVLAMGESFYETMTANGADRSVAAMDRFWRLAPVVDRKRWEAFRAYMIAETQINGSYYIESAIPGACLRVAERLDRIARRSRQAPQLVSSASSPV